MEHWVWLLLTHALSVNVKGVIRALWTWASWSQNPQTSLIYLWRPLTWNPLLFVQEWLEQLLTQSSLTVLSQISTLRVPLCACRPPRRCRCEPKQLHVFMVRGGWTELECWFYVKNRRPKRSKGVLSGREHQCWCFLKKNMIGLKLGLNLYVLVHLADKHSHSFVSLRLCSSGAKFHTYWPPTSLSSNQNG